MRMKIPVDFFYVRDDIQPRFCFSEINLYLLSPNLKKKLLSLDQGAMKGNDKFTYSQRHKMYLDFFRSPFSYLLFCLVPPPTSNKQWKARGERFSLAWRRPPPFHSLGPFFRFRCLLCRKNFGLLASLSPSIFRPCLSGKKRSNQTIVENGREKKDKRRR